MNTRPLFSDVAPKFDPLAEARLTEDRASKRLAWIRRRIRGADEKLKAYELAITQAALRGRMVSERALVNVLRQQVESLRDDERCALASLQCAETKRRKLESAA